MEKLMITVDGPAGAGKTTVSRLLAEKLGYRYMDTGALYRGVAYEVIRLKISPEDSPAVNTLCRNLKLTLTRRNNQSRLISNGVDITDQIRTPEISMMASRISAKPVVRNALLHFQREMGNEKGMVAEGRDMGTVVFPMADVKFFIHASLEARAMRRFKEMQEASEQSLDQVKEEMARRDENDRTRITAPLKPAQDAVMIDTSFLEILQVVDKMIKVVFKHLGKSRLDSF